MLVASIAFLFELVPAGWQLWLPTFELDHRPQGEDKSGNPFSLWSPYIGQSFSPVSFHRIQNILLWLVWPWLELEEDHYTKKVLLRSSQFFWMHPENWQKLKPNIIFNSFNPLQSNNRFFAWPMGVSIKRNRLTNWDRRLRWTYNSGSEMSRPFHPSV